MSDKGSERWIEVNGLMNMMSSENVDFFMVSESCSNCEMKEIIMAT